MSQAFITEPEATAASAAPPPRPTKVRHYTYDEVLAEFPETNQPCELCDGELIFMAPPGFHHQEVSFRPQSSLHEWVSTRKLGKVIASPIDMVLSPRQVRQPDVAFITRERLHIIERVINGPVV